MVDSPPTSLVKIYTQSTEGGKCITSIKMSARDCSPWIPGWSGRWLPQWHQHVLASLTNQIMLHVSINSSVKINTYSNFLCYDKQSQSLPKMSKERDRCKQHGSWVGQISSSDIQTSMSGTLGTKAQNHSLCHTSSSPFEPPPPNTHVLSQRSQSPCRHSFPGRFQPHPPVLPLCC